MNTVDVLIPTYKPGIKLIKLIERLEKQSYPINRIILLNTERELFVKAFGDEDIFEKYANVTVEHITKDEFDHAASRTKLVNMSTADYFVFMTDDALPLDKKMIENLVKPLFGGAAIAYGRQCGAPNSGETERFTRLFNYPKQSRLKTKADKEALGIKTIFCSDVCAAYNRNVFDSLGGFVNRAIFNEDMIYASKVIESGYAIYYSAEARVQHSHNYNCIQQLRRNFDLGVSQAEHPEVFGELASTGEGIRLVKETCLHLFKKGKYLEIFIMFLNSACKFIGFKLGKNYQKLPKSIIMKLTMNQVYWNK